MLNHDYFVTPHTCQKTGTNWPVSDSQAFVFCFFFPVNLFLDGNAAHTPELQKIKGKAVIPLMYSRNGLKFSNGSYCQNILLISSTQIKKNSHCT